MADRLKSLQRIGAVQDRMVQLAEWRLAAAETVLRDLTANRERLRSYVVEESALGVPLARAALRSLQMLDQRLRLAERAREEGRVKLLDAKNKSRALSNLTDDVGRQARRAAEDKALAATLETWLGAGDASLR